MRRAALAPKMRNIKLTIEYDGTAYRGWQVQPGRPTIQGMFQEKIGVMTRERVCLIASGRTDAGVHALGQVANFKTESRISLDSLHRGLNSLLPNDIAVKRVEEVGEDFHSRFSAKSKLYEYRIFNNPVPSPIEHRFSWHISQKLVMNNLREAGHTLLGTHDFSSFCSAHSDNMNPIRSMLSLEIQRNRSHILSIRLRANAFLKQMVRNIVGTLVDVGRERISPEGFKKILDARDRTKAGMTAPARGLFLVEVEY